MKNLNWKKLWLTVLVVFAAIWITDWVIHGMILKPTYEATPSLWRSPEEMEHFFTFMLAGQFGVGLFMVWIFVHGYRGTGWSEGVRYGLLMGGLAAANQMIMYAVAPYPMNLTLSWIGFGFIQCILAGILASWVYGRPTHATA